MRRVLLSLCLLAVHDGRADGHADRGSEVHYVDATLELETQLLSWRFVDVDADGVDELCLAVRSSDGGRELRLHTVSEHRIVAEPRQVVRVLQDVVAYCFADVRAEEGRELVLLTRTGAWSYSLLRDGYRGNVARLVTEDLLYDVPDPRELPYWSYVLDSQGPDSEGTGSDRVLLPGRDGYSVWSSGTNDGSRNGSYARTAQYAGDADSHWDAARRDRGERGGGGGRRDGGGGVVIESSYGASAKVLIADEDASGGNLLAEWKSFLAPALVDLNGDGRRDLLRRRGDALHVHLATEHGPASHATRVEPFPNYLQREGEHLSLDLADLDADGDVDLLARWEQEEEGLENRTITIQVLENDGRRLLPERPTQVLRFEAAALGAHVADVNGDGRPDLVVRKFEMPSLLEVVTGLEFALTHLLFLGEEGAHPSFARRPVLKHVETFDEETILDAIASRDMSMDCDGDGVADLVEVDVRGRVAIRRLKHSSSVFRGDAWSLDRGPWKRFEVQGSLESLTVRDLNGDGLGDIVSSGPRSLMVLLSDNGGSTR